MSQADFFLSPQGFLCITVDKRVTYIRVKPIWNAPLSHPNTYLSLLNEVGEEVFFLESLASLPKEDQALLQEELLRRDGTALVREILSIEEFPGGTIWRVDTNRGNREFHLKGSHEHIFKYPGRQYLLIDTSGNRFKIPSLDLLSHESQNRLKEYL